MDIATYLLIFLSLFCSNIHLTSALTVTPTETNYPDVDYACRSNEVWIRPSWPSNIGEYCRQILRELIATEPEATHDGFRHEFLPPGQIPDPETGTYPVRTPWKLSSGPCTLAITTIHSVPVGWLPTVLGPGPFPPSGYATWMDILHLASAILYHCTQDRVAGMSWTQNLDTLMPALGVFFYSTGSQIDRIIGPKVNGVFTLPYGVNFTGSAERRV